MKGFSRVLSYREHLCNLHHRLMLNLYIFVKIFCFSSCKVQLHLPVVQKLPMNIINTNNGFFQ